MLTKIEFATGTEWESSSEEGLLIADPFAEKGEHADPEDGTEYAHWGM